MLSRLGKANYDPLSPPTGLRPRAMTDTIRLVALDWGTTSLRAYVLGQDGSILERRSGGRGLMQLDPDGGFEAALVEILGRLVNRQVRKRDNHLPTVTVVTSAYNEVAHIEATVRDKLSQDYPADLLEVVVVSDGSDDGTTTFGSATVR